jgi:hypothetical protein
LCREEEEGDAFFYFLLFLPSVGFLPVDEMGRKGKKAERQQLASNETSQTQQKKEAVYSRKTLTIRRERKKIRE